MRKYLVIVLLFIVPLKSYAWVGAAISAGVALYDAAEKAGEKAQAWLLIGQ